MVFDRWDVALAHFPFAERSRGTFRPVLVVSSAEYNRAHDLIVALMITSASEGMWESDHPIVGLSPAGLRKACVVRFKMATLRLPLVDRRIGSLAEPDRLGVGSTLSTILPLTANA